MTAIDPGHAATEIEGGEPIPLGQKLFLVDGEEFPLLEVRKIEFAVRESTAA